MKSLKYILLFITLFLININVVNAKTDVMNIVFDLIDVFKKYFICIIILFVFIIKHKNIKSSKPVIKLLLKIFCFIIIFLMIAILLTSLFLKFEVNLVVFLILILAIIIIYYIYSTKDFFKKIPGYKVDYSERIINDNDINHYTDIPCDKNIFKAFFLTRFYLFNEKPSNSNLLGSVLLKWFFEGKIEIKNNNDINVYNRDKKFIVLKSNLKLESDVEDELYNMLYLASKDGILTKKEIEEWTANNFFELIKWFSTATNYGRSLYINEGLIKKEDVKFEINNELKYEAVNLASLKKYLIDFSRISKKIPIKVNLYKEYLIYSEIFGLSDIIVKKFYKFYLEDINSFDNKFDISLVDTIALINSISKFIVDSSIKAINERKKPNSFSMRF